MIGARTLLVVVLTLLPGAAAGGGLRLAAGEPLTLGVVRELLESALPAQAPSRRLDLLITTPRFPLRNDSESPVELQVDELRLDDATQRFAADLVVRVAGRVTGAVKVEGQARPMLEVPVPVQTIREGQTITLADLGTAWLAEGALRPESILAAEAIIGREAGRSLGPGRPVRSADLRAPRLIHKGDVVMLTYSRRGFELTALAKALEDGAIGERIRAVNVDSNRPVAGVVLGARRLAVGEVTP